MCGANEMKKHLLPITPFQRAETVILLVDEDTSLREMLCMALESEPSYIVSAVATVTDALRFLRFLLPDLMIIDYELSSDTGLHFYDQIHQKNAFPPIPGILLSAPLASCTLEPRPLWIVQEPFDLATLLSTVKQAALYASRQSKERGREEAAQMGTVEALATLVEVRDPATGHHAHQVADLVLQLALAMGLPVSEAQMIALAGRLHDVGKVSIPDAVLQKPGGLSAEEGGLGRTHPMVGADVVGHIPALRPLLPVIRAHHQRWDGQGYPDHLQGEAIPLGARLLMAVDAYLAMTVDRPYQKARAPSVALTELRRCAGSQFDPQVVAALERVLFVGQLPSPGVHGRMW